MLDLDRLLKLRVAIARVGEMDCAKWWNTRGQLGPYGTSALKRGFPRTHYFAQARSVFAVAAQRCKEIYQPPRCVTLWALPETIEEEFDARWEHWLDNANEWTPLFEKIESVQNADVAALLGDLKLLENNHVEAVKGLRRTAEGRAVALSGHFSSSDDDVTLLALAFGKGEAGALAVPYMALP